MISTITATDIFEFQRPTYSFTNQIASAAERVFSKKKSLIFSGAGKSTLMSALAFRNPGTFG